ncbi:MAG: SAM-dependent DNA methyltransferase [Deltaproteobacteria bacterium]|nr:SAM-dependent DNA methyltransferase [Deltaproteobacteria bacterium]
MLLRQTHSGTVNFIWGICNLLRGPYKRNEYRKVILPLTVLRRFDCLLEPTKEAVLEAHEKIKKSPDNIIRNKLCKITGVSFYNVSKFNFKNLLDDPANIASNLEKYINGFSPNVRNIFEKFKFEEQIIKMNDKNLLYQVIQSFADNDKIDLSPDKIDNTQMGYIFEELIRVGAEQANEEAGEHFTPREVIRLMVSLLLSSEEDLNKDYVVKEIYDPACGTGGMLSAAREYIIKLNDKAHPHLYGQDINDDSWAVCSSDMLIKGNVADSIKHGCIFEKDEFKNKKFDYMLANPPFGVEWKQQEKTIKNEKDDLGYDGRFGAGLPRINDGSLLFLQHMISKMEASENGGSKIAIVFNGSPLFTGSAGSGESEIRRWIIENDFLEAIVALPNQLFYNTGISTYIWILTNKKSKKRKGKIQLINAVDFYVKMRKSLGNKRNAIGEGEDGYPNQIKEILKIHSDFLNKETGIINNEKIIVSKIFANQDFGYNKITIEQPLRLNFKASDKRIKKMESQKVFNNLFISKKKNKAQRLQEINEKEQRREIIKSLFLKFKEYTEENLFKNKSAFLEELKGFAEQQNIFFTSAEIKAILSGLSQKDETADICLNPKGEPLPDKNLTDTENIPLAEDINKYFNKEILPHVPNAWIDFKKTKIGYEIPFNRHFYKYKPLRSLENIEADINSIGEDIIKMIKDITASKGLKG